MASPRRRLIAVGASCALAAAVLLPLGSAAASPARDGDNSDRSAAALTTTPTSPVLPPTPGVPPTAAATLPSEAVVEGEVLVEWKPGVTGAQRKQGRARLEVTLEERLPLADVDQVELPSGVSVDEALETIAADPLVESVQPNYLYARQADPYFGELWGLNNTGQTIRGSKGVSNIDIDANYAWARSEGEGVVVAVIDTGVQIQHPDLSGSNIWRNSGEIPGNGIDDDGNGYVDDLNGWDFVNDNASVYDGEDCGGFNNDAHGTHVAGTIAAKRNGLGIEGVAPKVQIMTLKTIGCGGGSSASVVKAINYAKANGADIANMSLGGPFADGALQNAIGASGLLVVAAAGNGDFGTYSAQYGLPSRCFSAGGDPVSLCPMYPAALPSSNIISVAAVTNRGQLASFSQYGRVGPGNSTARGVDMGAPGVDTLSTYPANYGSLSQKYGYAYASGTSMAAPHVSGVAALALAQNPGLSVSALKAKVLNSGKRVGAITGSVTLTGRMAHAGGAVGITKLSTSYSKPTVTYGYGTVVTGTLALSSGPGVAGRTLQLRRYVPSTNTWVVDCTVTTNSAGQASCYRKPGSTTTYEWHHAGSSTFTTSWSGQSTVRIKARIGISASTKTPRVRQSVTIRASVAPGHGGQPVWLQQKVNGSWRNVASGRLFSSSARNFTITPTKAGTTYWRINFRGDSDHLANYSGTLSIRAS